MNQTIKHPILSRNGFNTQIHQTIRHPTQNNLTSLEKQNEAISNTYYLVHNKRCSQRGS